MLSPSFWYNHGIAFRYEEEYSKNNKELPVRVFMSAGVDEKTYTRNICEGVRRMTEVFEMRKYGGLVYETAYFEEENHMSVVPASFSRGLISVFKP